jgi:hypothetical protein
MMGHYDRPTLEEMIDAARMHIETAIIPVVKSDPKLYFQTLVAINVLKIASREVVHDWVHLRTTWEELNHLQNRSTLLPSDADAARTALDARRVELCNAIRAGVYDDRTEDMLDHLLALTRRQLEVANPKFLETLDAEDLTE